MFTGRFACPFPSRSMSGKACGLIARHMSALRSARASESAAGDESLQPRVQVRYRTVGGRAGAATVLPLVISHRTWWGPGTPPCTGGGTLAVLPPALGRALAQVLSGPKGRRGDEMRIGQRGGDGSQVGGAGGEETCRRGKETCRRGEDAGEGRRRPLKGGDVRERGGDPCGEETLALGQRGRDGCSGPSDTIGGRRDAIGDG